MVEPNKIKREKKRLRVADMPNAIKQKRETVLSAIHVPWKSTQYFPTWLKTTQAERSLPQRRRHTLRRSVTTSHTHILQLSVYRWAKMTFVAYFPYCKFVLFYPRCCRCYAHLEPLIYFAASQCAPLFLFFPLKSPSCLFCSKPDRPNSAYWETIKSRWCVVCEYSVCTYCFHTAQMHIEFSVEYQQLS